MTKTRKSGSKNTAETVLGVGVGLAVGTFGVPKLVEMVDKEGKVNPYLVDGGQAVLGYFAARKTKGMIQSGAIGFAAGGVLNGILRVAGIGSIPHPGYYYDQVAGPQRMQSDTV